MIIQSIFDALYALIASLLDKLPTIGDMPGWLDNTLNVLSYGLMFFPLDVFVLTIGSIGFWLLAHMVWAIVEWVYKKIPGID